MRAWSHKFQGPPVAAVVVCAFAIANVRGGVAEESDDLTLRTELGITLAFDGQHEESQRAFLSVLSHDPHNLPALNNLGNLDFIRGETASAIELYREVLARDADQLGTTLKCSLALLLSGDREGAIKMARIATSKLGSAEAAESMLGLLDPNETVRAEPGSSLTAEEVRALLLEAMASTPVRASVDSTQSPAAPDSSSNASQGAKHSGRWRIAGTRATQPGPNPPLLHWMQ